MKKFVSTMFALFLMIALLPTAAKADNGNTFTLTQDNLSTFLSTGNFYINANTLSEAGHGTVSTIVLGENITTDNSAYTYITSSITLDLNGHTYKTNTFVVNQDKTLTLIDSSSNGGGKIVTSSCVSQEGTLKAHGGTIEGAVQNYGTITVGTGVATATTFTGAVENKDNGVINGGTFSTSSTVTNYNTLMGGTFNGTIINGGIIYGGTFYGTVTNGYETPGYKSPSSSGYKCCPGKISGGKFYGTVENPSFFYNEHSKNYIYGGWFYQNAPDGNVDYKDTSTSSAPVYKITYQSKSGRFLGMNVLKGSDDSTGVTPVYSYMPEGKTGETFDCWYKDKDCTQKVDKESGKMVTEDTTLYGKTKTGDDSAEIEDPWDNPFEDVHEYDWFYNSVKFCHKRGWFNGKTKTLFAPYDTFTRAEISAVLYNRAGTPAVNTNRVLYVDVKEGAWYTKAVYWMTDRGNAVGANNHFYPDNPVTREEMATMLYNAAGRPETNGTLFQYLDKDDGSDWAYEALCWVVEKGIMIGDGDGTLRPKDNVTRAEAASIMRSFGIAGYGDYVATN